jgi:hypothetical protein
MIYQTGLVSVPKLDTLGFLPGALADHLTSSGGDLLGSDEQSVLAGGRRNPHLWHGFRAVQLLAEISSASGFA